VTVKIVTAPHQSLRKKAQKITKVSDELTYFLDQLGDTLANKSGPTGVGLAGTQVDTVFHAFATYLSPDDVDDDTNRQLRFFLNPRITKASKKVELGPSEKNVPVEGCLSIPGIFGPVPRHPWVELTFEEVDGDKLSTKQEHFDAFPARLVQHELDHLDGILFTDYSLEYDLPLYTEDKETEKLVEVADRSIVEIF